MYIYLYVPNLLAQISSSHFNLVGIIRAMAVKGKGSQTKDGESQKEDDRKKKTPEEKIPKNPWNGESQKEDESKKKTPEEKIPKNPWNRFQQRLKGSGIGGDKKLLSALYQEEQKALQTLKVDEKQVQCGV